MGSEEGVGLDTAPGPLLFLLHGERSGPEGGTLRDTGQGLPFKSYRNRLWSQANRLELLLPHLLEGWPPSLSLLTWKTGVHTGLEGLV